MKTCMTKAHLDSAAAFSQRPVTGNEIPTLDYIPGSSLRGAVAAQYLAKTGGKPDADFDRIFGKELLKFPNLYPMGKLPVPLSAYTCKHCPGFKHDPLLLNQILPHGVVDMLFVPLNHKRCTATSLEDAKRVTCSHPLVRLPAQFYHPNLESHTGRRWLQARTAVSAGGSAVQGSLHTQQELLEGSDFNGEILGDGPSLERLISVLGESVILYLGKRRLGKLQITFEDVHDPAQLQTGAALVERPGMPGLWTVLKLNSDAILVDHLLRPLRTLTIDYLTSVCSCPPGVEVVKAYTATRIVAGWSEVGQLFRPDDLAIRMGSTFLLHFPGDTRQAVEAWMAQVVQAGLGLRQGEGFGCITFHDPIHLNSINRMGSAL